jgi:uncharacterized protein YndB with AHSA1/START domain
MKSQVETGPNWVRITRTFAAPRALVFSFWTKAERLQQWSGCKDAARCEVVMDFRVGGTFTQKMLITGAGEFTLTGTYEQIVEPERIVYSANLGPAVTRVTVEFLEEASGTRMVLMHEGLPSEMHCKAISQGTSESFDKLEALLLNGVAVR